MIWEDGKPLGKERSVVIRIEFKSWHLLQQTISKHLQCWMCPVFDYDDNCMTISANKIQLSMEFNT